MLKRKKIITFMLCLILSFPTSLMVNAASASQVAYVYGFDYGDGVNTTAIAQQEQMYLSNMGYTAYCNTDVSAPFAIGTSPTTNKSRMNCGVFVFNGHAAGGAVNLQIMEVVKHI